MSHQVNVFISHAWAYTEHYEKLSEWIFENQWSLSGVPIKFNNLSVPQSDPIHDASTDSQLKDALYSRIIQSDVIVIPTGMYATHSKWIQKELDGSKLYYKPILAVNTWGSQRQPGVVMQAADDVVKWNKQSVISGVWELYKK